MPIKNATASPDSRADDATSQAPSDSRVGYKQVVHWLRLHLGGRQHVDLDRLRIHVQGLTDGQWLAALGPSALYHRRQHTNRASSTGADLAMIPDPNSDPSQTVYLRQLLSILENNLMSEEIPYFRALVRKTTARDLAAELGANPKTTANRLTQVRKKAQAIIQSLRQRVSS